MVVSSGSDPYATYQPPIIPEDGPQSSEDGSGMHSPVFGAGHYPAHSDNGFRYPQNHLDIQHSTGMMAPSYDYGHSMSAQQPPILDTSLELPNTSARVPFSPQYSVSTRNQLGIDFPVQSPVNSRIPPVHGVPPVGFRYSPPGERRLPSGPTHDHSYIQQAEQSSGAIVDDDRCPADSSDSRLEATLATSTPSPSSKSAKRESTNVVIACRQCRARKIRCDSNRPLCGNCERRSNDCEYDEKPRRRGPDKRPGTRQRSCKKRPTDGSAPPSKRKKTAEPLSEESEGASSKPDNSLESRPSPGSRLLDRYPSDLNYPLSHPSHAQPASPDFRPSDPNNHYKHELPTSYRRPSSSYVYDQGSYTKLSYPHQPDINTVPYTDVQRATTPPPRSLEPEQKAWWDRILRSHPLNIVFDEITFLVHNTGHLLSFINLDYIMKRLYSEERLHIQPAFIYAVLALARLMRSSKLENGSVGLSHALDLVHQAHAAYKDAVELHWLDVTLVEAALILALFECSAHPQHSSERIRASLVNLDSLIRNLSLTSIDSHDRTACRFSLGRVPVVQTDTPLDTFAKEYKCSCISPDMLDPLNQDCSLSWDPSWSPHQISDEEVRRLCWSSLAIISDYVLHCEMFNDEPPRFYVTEPSNYVLLFPREVVDRVSPAFRVQESLSPKESIWALYCRSMLLWNFCHRYQTIDQQADAHEHAHEAIVETQAIENALDAHTCNIDLELIHYCKEYIHSTRMVITHGFRNNLHGPTSRMTSSPVFKRKQAQDWLFYEEQVFQRLSALVHNLAGPAGHQLTRRPFRITGFINQLSNCLVLWNRDTTLDDALRLGKQILNLTDVVNELWPCSIIQHKCASLRQRLTEACSSRRIEGPGPEGFAVPPILRAMRG